MLPCSSHLIILTPLLDSALLAFFLEVPLDPQSNIGTLANTEETKPASESTVYWQNVRT